MNNALWILSSSPQMMRHICTIKHLQWILIDLEHSSFSFSELTAFVEIIRSHKKTSCFRIANLTRESILHSIELNPDIIMIPSISNAKQVEQAIDYFYVPPQGTRGFSPYSYPGTMESNFETAKATTLCLQLESKNALDNIDIFNKPGLIDSVFIGRYDLSRSCGMDIDSSIYFELLIETAKTIKTFGLKVGTVCLNHDEYNQLTRYYDFLSIGSDVTRMLESERIFKFLP